MGDSINTLDKNKIWIQRIDDTINNHFRNTDFDFYVLSDLISISTSKLYSVIKKERNDTPGKYILKRRLDEAMKLLNESSISLKQITHVTGFNDYSFFTLSFKGRFGKTPEEVIKSKEINTNN